jgi:hypothetical protein
MGLGVLGEVIPASSLETRERNVESMHPIPFFEAAQRNLTRLSLCLHGLQARRATAMRFTSTWSLPVARWSW